MKDAALSKSHFDYFFRGFFHTADLMSKISIKNEGAANDRNHLGG